MMGVGHKVDNLILENVNVEKPKERCRSDYRKGSCRQRKDMNLVMWNILSLNRIVAFKKLKDELRKYKVVIAVVQEVRWRRSEIFYSGDFTIQTAVKKSSHCLEQDL
jgi:hypothetical protein